MSFISSMVAQGVGAVMGGYARGEEGKANEAAMKYRAAVARNNAIMAENQATYVTQVGNRNAQTRMLKGDLELEGAKAKFSAGNLDTGKGTSAANVLNSMSGVTNADVMTIRNNAARAAWGYRVQGQNYTTDAENYELEGKNARREGEIAEFTSILSGAATSGAKWSQYKSQGGRADTGKGEMNLDTVESGDKAEYGKGGSYYTTEEMNGMDL